MDKILITGAGGFLASRFIKCYENQYEIIPVKRDDLDITNEGKVIETIKNVKPNYVLHTAAIADTGRCEENKELSYNVNVLGSINVAKGCSMAGAKMIQLSTEQVYNGNREEGPYSEEDTPVPNTNYGKHKLMAEKQIRQILDDVWILRLTWLFGFPERFGKVNANIIWNVLSAILKGKTVRMPANEYRGMTYVYDLINSFKNILNIPYGTYNTGSENNLSTYDTAELVVEEMGLDFRIEDIIEKDEDRYRELPRDIRISNKKLKRLGVEFLTTEEAVKKCISEFHYSFK